MNELAGGSDTKVSPLALSITVVVELSLDGGGDQGSPPRALEQNSIVTFDENDIILKPIQEHGIPI
jgi:hypothetical protein